MAKLLRIPLGIILLLLGVLGFVLPVLQGWLFFSMGIVILSVDIPFLARFVCRIEKRFPRFKAPLERCRSFLAGSRKNVARCPSDPP